MGSLAHAVVLPADCSEGFLRQTHSVYCDFFRAGSEIKLLIIIIVAAVVMPHLKTNKQKHKQKEEEKRRQAAW